MRALVCVDAVMDAAKSGGWRVLTSTVRALAKLDVVPLAVVVPQDRAHEVAGLGSSIAVVPVAISPAQPLQNLAWHATRFPSLVRRLGARVLHVPTHNALVARKVCPTVVTIHDITEFHLKGHYDPLRTLYRRIVVPRNARLADRIATVSQWTADDIVRTLCVPPERVVVAPNGVDARFHPVPRSDAEQIVREALDIVPPYVLYVGQIHMPNKNLVRLVEAFATASPRMAPHTKLVLCGRELAGGDLVRLAIRRLGLEHAVRWLGYVPDELLAAVYSAAEVFCYPSLKEGFGLPVLEAMACGVPVVTSDTTALAEVASGAALLVDPHDVTALSAALVRAVNDQQLRADLRRAGIERARRYSWEATAEILAREYQSLVNPLCATGTR